MIINNPHKILTLLLTFQKKKLYYNRISEAQIYLPYRILAYVFLWAQLTIEQNQMPIKRGFLMLLIMVTLLSIFENKTASQILGSYSIPHPQPEIQLEKQAKYLTNPKKSTTPFYQFKSRHAKNYKNPQQEVYRSIVYSKNQDKINKNNQKLDRKYNMALNRFSDLTPLEFSETFTNLYKSNDKIKSYTKKLIDRQRLYDPTYTYPIDEVDFIRNNQDDFLAVRDHTVKYVNEKKTNVAWDNSDFRMVEEVFANLNPSVEFREEKNRQLKNYLDWNTFPKIKSFGFNIGNPILNNNDVFASLQRQINTIMQNTASTLPLKLTSSGDSILMSTSVGSGLSSGSGSISTSTSSNFSSSVIDWTVHAGKIRYQGVCGACYTFATSDVVASLYAIYKFGFFVALSTQQVVDCSTNGLTYGCNGGFLEGSYAYMQIKGIQTDTNYPYTSAISGMSNTCKKNGGSFKVTSFRNIQQGNCRALVNQLNYGPVSIGIAGYRLQFYSSGIFNDCNSYVDHAVVLIAYKGGVGWKIKNSWGADWGMGGFAWIADGNNCGICNMAVSARI